jgi:hypothetical protein
MVKPTALPLGLLLERQMGLPWGYVSVPRWGGWCSSSGSVRGKNCTQTSREERNPRQLSSSRDCHLEHHCTEPLASPLEKRLARQTARQMVHQTVWQSAWRTVTQTAQK